MMLYISVHYAFTDHLNIIIYKNGLKLKSCYDLFRIIYRVHAYLFILKYQTLQLCTFYI